MFDDRRLYAWPLVIVGGLLFANLFGGLALMVEVLFEGEPRLTSEVVGFASAAFIGYVVTMLYLKRKDTSSDE